MSAEMAAHLSLRGVDLSIELGATIAGLVAAVAGAAGLFQYFRAESQKRAEFAVTQVQNLTSNETLAFCCRAVDWGVGPLIIPEKYRVLFPVGSRELINHDWRLMASALRPSLSDPDFSGDRSAQYLLYRYAFDEYFSYLDSIAMYRNYRIISDSDLSSVNDYVRQMRRPLYWLNQIDGLSAEQVFGDFAEAFYGLRVWPWMLSLDHPAGHTFRTGGRAKPAQLG